MSTNLGEIPRELEVHNLSEKEIVVISKIVFYAPPAELSDVLFIFGNSRGNWEGAIKRYASGCALLILASGYGGRTDDTVETSQAQKIKQALVFSGVPDAAIFLEEKSTNKLKKVTFSKRLLDEKGICPASICYVSLNGHSGRCYLTLKKYFPDAKLTA